MAPSSTLPTHLKPDRADLCLWLLLGGVLGVVASLLAGQIGLAIVLAALVAPTTYLAYVSRAYARAGKPLAGLALTVLVGGLAGAGLALVSRQYLERLALAQVTAMAQGQLPASLLLFLGITLPLVGELLKLAGPLLLLRWPQFRDAVMNGAVLGAASGVGFAAASTLVNYGPVILGGYSPIGATGLLEWTATLFGLAILRPLVHGVSSGLIGAGIWSATLRRGTGSAPVVMGLGGAVAYNLGELLLLSRGTLAVLCLHGVVLLLLLLAMRRTLREARTLDARALG